jgi:ketosteroid isomerase-like protein
MSSENVELIRRVYEGWASGDASTLELLDADIEVRPDPGSAWPGIEPVYHGRDGVNRYLASIYAAFAEYRAEAEDMLDAGDQVVVLAIERARGKSSGAPVEIRHTAHVWTVASGRAVRLDVNWDRQRALASVQLSATASDALLRQVAEAWNRGDRDLAVKLVDPEVELRSPLSSVAGEPYRGHEGFRRWIADIDDQFETWQVELAEVREVGPARMLALGTVHARGRGSGLELDWPAALLAEVRAGLLVRLHIFASQDEALAHLGSSGAADAPPVVDTRPVTDVSPVVDTPPATDASPAADAPSVPGGGAGEEMSPGEKLDLARRSYAAFNAGPDADALVALYHPDCEWRMGHAGAALGTAVFSGHDGLRSFARQMGEAMNDLQLSIDEARLAPDGSLLVRAHVAGRSTVQDMELRMQVWQQAEFRDGLLHRVVQLEEPPAAWESAEPIA